MGLNEGGTPGRPAARRGSSATAVLLAAALLAACGCQACSGEPPADDVKESTGRNGTMGNRPTASEVLNEHAPRLMKIDGVVGVYEGALEDGRPCIVVMLKEERPGLRDDIPAELGGYPVKLEFGGEIRPLR